MTHESERGSSGGIGTGIGIGIGRLLVEVYAAVADHAAALGDEGLAEPSRAAGWSRKALLVHQLLDAQRALVALATPVPGPADVDAVTYWRPFRPDAHDGGAAARHGRFVARVAEAYDGSRGLVSQWEHTAAAAGRSAAAAVAADPAVTVETQGHVITVADLASTLVVEATVHLLDAYGSPPAAATEHTLAVLTRLHRSTLPDPVQVRAGTAPTGGLAPGVETILQATGRLPTRHPAYPLLG